MAERALKVGDYVRTTGYAKQSGIIVEIAEDGNSNTSMPDVKMRFPDTEQFMWVSGPTVVLIEAVESREQMHRDMNAYLAAPGAIPVKDEYEFVDAPKHYNGHPSGVECQIIIRECKDPMISFAMKHLWRSQWGGKPGQTTDQDLAKAIEYIQLEQARRAGKARL